MCGASPTGYAAGFQIYPETRTIMVFWSRYDAGDSRFAESPPSATRWPMESTRFVVSRVAGALDLDDEAFGPTRLDGGGQLTLSPRRCAEPALSSERVEDFGPPTPSGDWPGVYVNGDRLFQLEEVEGMLTSRLSSSGPQLSVRHYGDDIYFTEASQLTAIPTGFAFRLIRDEAGRRYVMVADRAYLHQDDRGPAG